MSEDSLKNYRLLLWNINGNFDDGCIIDFKRQTVIFSQASKNINGIERRILSLNHIVMGNCLGDTNPSKRFIRIEMVGIYDTDPKKPVETTSKELADVGYDKIQEIINSVIAPEDNLKMNIIPHRG